MGKNIPQIFLIISLIFHITTTFSYAQMGHGIMRLKGEGNIVESSEQESISDDYKSNGEKIYLTGESNRTGTIQFDRGPMWLRKHGGGCVSCHGTKGTGGYPVMMGTVITPDIRYKTLSAEDHNHEGEKNRHERYNDDLIKRAITKGINPDGRELDPTMPRWLISDDDANDLIDYLKKL